MALQVITGFTSAEIRDFAAAKLRPEAGVFSDGLACLAAVIDNGCSHPVGIRGGGRKSAEAPALSKRSTVPM